MRDDAMVALAALYRALDDEAAALADRLPVSCDGCGECCRFDAAEHVLYASELERRYLLRSVSGKAPNGDEAGLVAKGLRCPFQFDSTCLAREGRVLGCRLHFCDPRWASEAESLSERWHARLKKLHDDLGVEWNYARLLPL